MHQNSLRPLFSKEACSLKTSSLVHHLQVKLTQIEKKRDHMSLEQINIMIVDTPKGLDAFRRLLARQDDINIVGEATTGSDAIRLAHELKPHIIVLATQMANQNTYRTVELLQTELPEIATLLVAEPGQVALDLAEGSNLLFHPFSCVELRITLRYVFHNLDEQQTRVKKRRPTAHKRKLRVVRAA